MAVLHDRFGAFREEVKELLEKKQVRQWRASSLLPQHNSFLRAIHCGAECLVFPVQGSDGRSFRDEVVQLVSEDLRVRHFTPHFVLRTYALHLAA